jgi:uncharacterized membrane protein
MKWLIIIVILAIGIIAGLIKKSKIEVTSSFLVNANRIKVFEVLSDFESIPEWNSSVISSTIISTQVGVGCEFYEIRKEIFRATGMKFKVLEYKPNQYIKVEGHSGKTVLTFEYQIQEVNHKTLVKLTFIEMPKPLILAKLLRPVYQKSIDANMIKLKSLIEEQ